VSQSDSLGPAVLLIVTASDRSEAERIGETLVEKRLAAAGSVVPMIHSFFHGNGQLQRRHEALLLLKTSAAKSVEAQAELKAIHSYENPDILEVKVSGGSSAYIEWLLEEVR
jgi:periplasmic divalent cation tolerance protein